MSAAKDIPPSALLWSDSASPRGMTPGLGLRLRARVLLVDDEADARALYQRVLRPLDCEIHEAADAAEALRLLPELRPDLILLDVAMPGMSGLELCRRIKALGGSPATPVILVSAHLGTNEPPRAGFAAHADDVVLKPIDADDLHDRVAMSLRRLHDAAEIVRAHQDLQRLEQGRDSLMALLVHDFKGPLAVLDSCIAYLAKGIPADQTTLHEALSDASESTRALFGMVLNLLDVARLEQPGMVLNRQAIDVADIIATAVRQAERRSGRRQTVQASIAEGPITAEVDPELLRRALDNLIDNAIRHAPFGGRIGIEVTTTEASLLIQVSDDGPGVPRDERESLFGKFHSGPGSGRLNRGLGLFLCRLVAEAHGGSISVLDASGGGASFLMELPRRAPR